MMDTSDLAHQPFRVTTFGKFAVMQKHSERPSQYETLSNDVWKQRSHTRTLLRYLLCRPLRRVQKDVLLAALWPEGARSTGENSLSAEISILHSALSLLSKESLLAITTTRTNDMTFYELADQQQLWCDLDEFEQLLEHAAQLEREGQDPLSQLEAAYKLSRGEFLEDEIYSEWAQEKRRSVQMERQHLLHWLARLYIEHNLLVQAETLLLEALKADPANEDILCCLMVLLEEQGRPHEALRFHQQQITLLRERDEPGPRVQALVERIKNAPISGERPKREQQGHTEVLPISQNVQEQQVASQSIEILRLSNLVVPSSLLVPPLPEDAATWFGERVNDIKALLADRSDLSISPHSLQMRVHTEIEKWNDMPGKSANNANEYLLSRRTALAALATLSGSLLTKVQQVPLSALVMEEFLSHCTSSITACYHLMCVNGLATVEYALPKYLPLLAGLCEHSSSFYQKRTAYLAAQGCFLTGLIKLHRLRFYERLIYSRKAVEYAKLSGDTTLYVMLLASLGNTFYNLKQYLEMLQVYQEASYHLKTVPYTLKSKVFAGLAHAYAQTGQVQEALRYIGEARTVFPTEYEEVPSFLSMDYGLFQVILFEGLTFLDLDKCYPDNGYAQDAWNKLTQIDYLSKGTNVPERIRIEIVNQRAMAAVRARNMEDFRAQLIAGAEGAKALESEKRRQEAFANYKAATKAWPHEAKVLELADLLIQVC